LETLATVLSDEVQVAVPVSVRVEPSL